MACPVHYVEYEKGCRRCEAIVQGMLVRLRNMDLEIPFELTWEEKIDLIHKYKDAVTEDTGAEIL